MANILKDDVQTYVRELIERGFEPNPIEGMGLSQRRAFNEEEDHEIRQSGQRPRHMAPSEG
jgi:hypothetical protein